MRKLLLKIKGASSSPNNFSSLRCSFKSKEKHQFNQEANDNMGMVRLPQDQRFLKVLVSCLISCFLQYAFSKYLALSESTLCEH